ncbi:HNH endonuclease family protein, partial [Candidatus Venteria ishoeyi]|uniref:hypothetical protein n=1 Tax=Candidatus Venteria ishoeyi TaxID=1899563 RepID=UPI00255C8D5F
MNEIDMIKINKNMNNEPNSLKEFRTRQDIKTRVKNKEGGTYKIYSDEVGTKELRLSLLKEQGYICCYCMSNISISIENEVEKTKIEHYKPRDSNKKHTELELDFKNLYIACDGEKSHCDTYQDNK